MIETRLALPQRSPRPLSVPWIWRAPARTAANEFATACSVSLWAWMPTMIAGHMLDHLADDGLDLVRQRAAVGVAQHDPARALLVGGLGAGQRIGRIGLVAVEEMLAVEQHLAAFGLGGLHAVADRGEVFLERGLERDAHVIVPGLGDEADRLGLGVEQRGEPRIVRGRAAGPPRHAEGGEGGVAACAARRTAACRSDWRPDSRPRHSRCRARRACG